LSNNDFVALLNEEGILASPFDDGVIRFVTRREITGEIVAQAIEKIKVRLSK
jgi:threonine aldolase